MAVTDVIKNLDARTLTVTAAFDAPVARVWDLYADPRKLERWWGPPVYPATVTQHELQSGGTVRYFMTGPEGDQHHGYWLVGDVAAPHRFTFVDGFADAEGNTNDDLPTTSAVVELTALDDGHTRMVMTTTFASVAAMEQLVAMGMEDGLKEAMGQIQAILAED